MTVLAPSLQKMYKAFSSHLACFFGGTPRPLGGLLSHQVSVAHSFRCLCFGRIVPLRCAARTTRITRWRSAEEASSGWIAWRVGAPELLIGWWETMSSLTGCPQCFLRLIFLRDLRQRSWRRKETGRIRVPAIAGVFRESP